MDGALRTQEVVVVLRRKCMGVLSDGEESEKGQGVLEVGGDCRRAG